MTSTLALLLADGRFPAGGYAHSGGVEAAVNDGRIATVDDLRPFLAGRLVTAGRVAAGLAAAASRAHELDDLDALDREAAARMASPALRAASRTQGRHLLRAAAAILGRPRPAPARPDLHHAVAIGVVSASPVEAARWAAYESVAGPASAAVRLLGLDPFATWAVVAALGSAIDELAAEAVAAATRPLSELPACSAPLLDIGAERHASEEVTLFAS